MIRLKCKTHQLILFCTGMNTKTRPIDPDLTFRMMMDCIILN